MEVQEPFFKKQVAPAIQDATQSADEIRNGEKVCIFCKFLQGISKKIPGRAVLETSIALKIIC